jgi:hypothetical protein
VRIEKEPDQLRGFHTSIFTAMNDDDRKLYDRLIAGGMKRDDALQEIMKDIEERSDQLLGET